MASFCALCVQHDCQRCDGTAWDDGARPTYCQCWAFGHPEWTRTDPARWVGGDPDPRWNEDADMDAYERGRD